MGLLATTEDWLATIEGAPHLECQFSMPAGASEGQARMQAWTIWSHARANGSNDPARPIASRWLRLAKLSTAFAEVPELSASCPMIDAADVNARRLVA